MKLFAVTNPRKILTTVLIVVIASLAFIGVKAIRDRLEVVKQRQAAIEEFEKLKRETVGNAVREMDQNRTVPVDKYGDAVEKLRGQMGKIAGLGGSDALAMKVFSEFLAEMQQENAPYLQLSKKLEDDDIADMRTVKEKAELARRRNLAKECIEQNAKLLNFLNSAESRIRNKLQKYGASSSVQEWAAGDFAKDFGKSLDTRRRLCKANDAGNRAIVGMSDLLETEWGEWEEKGGKMVFADESTAEKYNEFVDGLIKSDKEQAVVMRELAELAKLHLKLSE